MEAIQCILVEDDPGSQEKLKEYISRIPFLKLKKCFLDSRNAFAYIKTHSTDLIFLDLMMEEFSGIQLLKSLEKRPWVIITSGYDRYALEAYELNVQDYLLKPFSFERFVKSVNRIYDLMFQNPASVSPAVRYPEIPSARDYFFVRNNYKMLRVRFAEIDFIQGLSNYLIIKTAKSTIFTLQGFKEIMNLLPPDKFMRVHRSYVIALDKIEFIQKNKIKIGDRMIPIGDSYRQLFMGHLRNHHMI